MNVLTNMTIRASRDPLAEEFHNQIVEPEELANATTVGARSDTATISIVDTSTGNLAAYAVIGYDDAGMVVIYAARSWMKGLGAVALKGLFNGAQAISKPLRVHAENIRAYARMMGASEVLAAIDADGVNMGVFDGQQE